MQAGSCQMSSPRSWQMWDSDKNGVQGRAQRVEGMGRHDLEVRGRFHWDVF